MPLLHLVTQGFRTAEASRLYHLQHLGFLEAEAGEKRHWRIRCEQGNHGLSFMGSVSFLLNITLSVRLEGWDIWWGKWNI